MRSVILMTVAALLLATTSASAGVLGLGYEVDYGNAYLPPTAESMGVTSLHYHEVGGPLGALIILVFETPIKPGVETTVTQEHECSSANHCLDYVKTTTTYPTEQELAAYDKAMASWTPEMGAALMRGELGQELDIDVAARSLGGSASGFMMKLWRTVPGLPSSLQFGQYAFGWLTFHDVHTRSVSATTTELMATDKVADFTFKYAGLPVRFRTPLGHSGFGLMVQLDMNALSLVMDQPSPIHANLQWAGYHAIISVGGMVSGFRPDGASLSAEAQLAF